MGRAPGRPPTPQHPRPGNQRMKEPRRALWTGLSCPWEPPGWQETAPGMGLQRQSCTWLSGTGWFGRIPPRQGQCLQSQAREVSFAPPRMLETPSPLPDGVSLGFSCFPLRSCKPRWPALGFPRKNFPPGSLQPGIWGDQEAAAWKGAPTMALRGAGLLLAVGSRQAAIARLQGAALIFFSLFGGKKNPSFCPHFIYIPL